MNEQLNINGSGFGFEALKALYLDWINNFLSIEAFANHHHISTDHAIQIINLGRSTLEAGNIWE